MIACEACWARRARQRVQRRATILEALSVALVAALTYLF